MKIKKLSIIFFIVCLSCNPKQADYEDAQLFGFNDFKATEQLTGTVLELDEQVMRASDILVCDSMLITIEYGRDKLFHIYNLNEKSQVNECIVTGQGPNDMLQPEFMQGDENFIRIIDLGTSTVFQYNTTDFFTNPSPEPTSRLKLEKQVFIAAQQAGENIMGYSYN